MLNIFNPQTTRVEQLLYQIMQRLDEIDGTLSDLEYRIEQLEEENIGTTNELYELHNRLDIMNDPKYIGLRHFNLGDA